jgi:hypothetical protein
MKIPAGDYSMAYARDEEEVVAAAAQWEKAFNEDGPDNIL